MAKAAKTENILDVFSALDKLISFPLLYANFHFVSRMLYIFYLSTMYQYLVWFSQSRGVMLVLTGLDESVLTYTQQTWKLDSFNHFEVGSIQLLNYVTENIFRRSF